MSRNLRKITINEEALNQSAAYSNSRSQSSMVNNFSQLESRSQVMKKKRIVISLDVVVPL